MLNKYKREKGLEGVFYIVDLSKGEDKQWWQLRLKENHYIVSAVGSKEKVLDCLQKVCMRYKTYKGLNRALKHCDKNISKEQFTILQKEYESIGRVYSDEVEEVISLVSEKLKGGKNTTKKLNKIHFGTSSPLPSPVIEEKVSVLSETKTVIKKTTKKKIGLINI